MDGWTRYRRCALALLGGVGMLTAAAGTVRAESVARAALRSAELAAPNLIAIGGHVTVPSTPPLPPTVTGDTPPPPPPPTDTGGTPTPPPPPTPQGGPGPTPPPPTSEGGPGPSSAPEPATIVTGLLGLGIASAAGWYQRRKRR